MAGKTRKHLLKFAAETCLPGILGRRLPLTTIDPHYDAPARLDLSSLLLKQCRSTHARMHACPQARPHACTHVRTPSAPTRTDTEDRAECGREGGEGRTQAEKGKKEKKKERARAQDKRSRQMRKHLSTMRSCKRENMQTQKEKGQPGSVPKSGGEGNTPTQVPPQNLSRKTLCTNIIPFCNTNPPISQFTAQNIALYLGLKGSTGPDQNRSKVQTPDVATILNKRDSSGKPQCSGGRRTSTGVRSRRTQKTRRSNDRRISEWGKS